MTVKKLNLLRWLIVLSALIVSLLIVAPALAQDGGGTSDAQDLVPEDLDDIAVRLMPLLVGAALIERTLEIVFTWIERALLDTSHSLNRAARMVTGFVQVDFRQAWENIDKLTNAMLMRQATDKALAFEGNPDSDDPNDWPLAMLEARLTEAKDRLKKAEDVIEKVISSPEYITRKKMVAAFASMVMGIVLAFLGSLRLFDPLGVAVADWFTDPFEIIDIVLAGILMGLGTEWVHQVIGILIKGKGALGRAGGGGGAGAQFDLEQVRMLAEQAVSQELTAQTRRVREQIEAEVQSLATSGGGRPEPDAGDDAAEPPAPN